MKILSVALVNHDTNFTYYDNGMLKYHKLERTKQQKRFVLYPITTWKDEVKSLWNLKFEEINDIIFQFDSFMMLPKDLQKYIIDMDSIQPLHIKICKFLNIKKGWFVGHHFSHAKSTWMFDNLKSDIQIVIDGLGDGRPWSIYRNNRLIDKGNIARGSLGWAMRDAGKFLGIKAIHQNDIAGKLMALQSYGNINESYLNSLSKYTIEDANLLFNPQSWTDTTKYVDWIRTVHYKTGHLLVDFFKKYAKSHETISYSGGVAQNVVWNTELKKHFPNLIIPPHSSDEGISLGSIACLFEMYNIELPKINNFPYCQSDITPLNIPSDNTIDKIVDLLSNNKTVGVYFDNGEIGPRALGNRSILMNPKIKKGKEKINRIKKREQYRPFGASILKNSFDKYFEECADPYMLYTATFKSDSSEFDSINHIDNTCRLQLCSQGYIKKILDKFDQLTGCPMLLNTSLNIAGKPIAGFPQDAFKLFNESELDSVIIGDKVYEKNKGNVK